MYTVHRATLENVAIHEARCGAKEKYMVQFHAVVHYNHTYDDPSGALPPVLKGRPNAVLNQRSPSIDPLTIVQVKTYFYTESDARAEHVTFSVTSYSQTLSRTVTTPCIHIRQIAKKPAPAVLILSTLQYPKQNALKQSDRLLYPGGPRAID